MTLASGYGVSGQCAVESHVAQPLNALRNGRQTVQVRALCTQYGELAQAGTQRLLQGPTGNTWTLLP